MAAVVLNGITGHSRGITPLLVVSQRYSELHPEVEIRWKKRTLQEFADYPIEELTKDYDPFTNIIHVSSRAQQQPPVPSR